VKFDKTLIRGIGLRVATVIVYLAALIVVIMDVTTWRPG
jgi:hypothetical protein